MIDPKMNYSFSLFKPFLFIPKMNYKWSKLPIGSPVGHLRVSLSGGYYGYSIEAGTGRFLSIWEMDIFYSFSCRMNEAANKCRQSQL
jgi:hypothetical protein